MRDSLIHNRRALRLSWVCWLEPQMGMDDLNTDTSQQVIFIHLLPEKETFRTRQTAVITHLFLWFSPCSSLFFPPPSCLTWSSLCLFLFIPPHHHPPPPPFLVTAVCDTSVQLAKCHITNPEIPTGQSIWQKNAVEEEVKSLLSSVVPKGAVDTLKYSLLWKKKPALDVTQSGLILFSEPKCKKRNNYHVLFLGCTNALNLISMQTFWRSAWKHAEHTHSPLLAHYFIWRGSSKTETHTIILKKYIILLSLSTSFWSTESYVLLLKHPVCSDRTAAWKGFC